MSEPITVGGHLRIRPFNTADSYPEQRLDNDLCQAVVAGNTVYLRGQVPQDLETGENVGVGDPAAQASAGGVDQRHAAAQPVLHVRPLCQRRPLPARGSKVMVGVIRGGRHVG